MSAPTLTSDDVRAAFDRWFETLYSPPTSPSESLDWDSYNLRLGLAWTAFQAGLRLGLKGKGSGS
jgi:hypothetical protein